ncbi:MAG: glycoside hydrolase family 44 protein [Spirochaetales bacterium]|nr:glycoside hydrolase family 44 protein [Spirochaetales bacterium]
MQRFIGENSRKLVNVSGLFCLTALLSVLTACPADVPPGGGPSLTGPVLTVAVDQDRHTISPYIYGMNFADQDLAQELTLPVRRMGGNSTTRYNYLLDVHNTGSDWYFENVPDDNSHPENLPDGSSADRFIDQDQTTGTKTIITIPMIGWTPKERKASHPFDCGFKVSIYGPQDDVDTWDIDCGCGTKNGGTKITGNDPADTSTLITETFATGWIGHLTGKYNTAGAGGVLFYSLDNEPMLWNSTHRDVHPAYVSYDDMKNLTIQYAAAIKAADPTAMTLGPVLWGWTAFFYSAKDTEPGGSWWENPQDRFDHGGIPFVEWYLQQMKDYETASGVRILDYLDLHIYPQYGGVYSSNLGSADVQAARLRSTRQLWDPAYRDETWIDDFVRLIPRMKGWVADNYPGTKCALTEYNWGALGYMNGALAQADILGIFGWEGLDLATLWGPPKFSEPGAYAFRMYLNYDGSGGKFGETSVQASSTDQGTLAIYAAQRTSDNALTIIVVNKAAVGQGTTVTLSGFSPAAQAQLYRYSSANLGAVIHEANLDVSADVIEEIFPASSISLIIVPQL